MSHVDQSADIEIPVVEITRGWTVDDIETLDDCDDAFAYLTGAVCSIEYQMDTISAEGGVDTKVYRKLKSALRWKKAALSIVNTKKGRISRKAQADMNKTKDRLLIEEMKAIAPDAFRQALANMELLK